MFGSNCVAGVDEEFGFDCREKDSIAGERSVSVWNTSGSTKQGPPAWTLFEDRASALRTYGYAAIGLLASIYFPDIAATLFLISELRGRGAQIVSCVYTLIVFLREPA